MKHIKFFVSLLILIGLATTLFLHQKKNGLQENMVKTNPTSTSVNETVASKKPPTSNAPPAPSFITDTNDAYILALPVGDFYELEKIDHNLEWKMPINFWGRIVDESNNPVGNVGVHFVWNDLSENGTSEVDVKSDGNGFFSLAGRRGKGLSVSVGKDGYYGTSSSRQSFEYAQPNIRFVPDQNNPVVFQLRKKGEGESLVSRETFYGLKPDGTPQYLDLRTGTKTTGGAPTGDLMMQLTRTATDDPQRFNWTFILQGIGDAGLIESQDEFMFEAPESDYGNAIKQEGRADDYPYRNEVKKNTMCVSQMGKLMRESRPICMSNITKRPQWTLSCI